MRIKSRIEGTNQAMPRRALRIPADKSRGEGVRPHMAIAAEACWNRPAGPKTGFTAWPWLAKAKG